MVSVWMPNASETDACATSRTPSDAASFASGDAVRSGRKTTNSMRTPTTTSTTSVRRSATAVGACQPWYSPVFSDQYE